MIPRHPRCYLASVSAWSFELSGLFINTDMRSPSADRRSSRSSRGLPRLLLGLPGDSSMRCSLSFFALLIRTGVAWHDVVYVSRTCGGKTFGFFDRYDCTCGLVPISDATSPLSPRTQKNPISRVIERCRLLMSTMRGRSDCDATAPRLLTFGSLGCKE